MKSYPAILHSKLKPYQANFCSIFVLFDRQQASV